MVETVPRGRYAPSPTGRLHLGNARTALLSWLDIRLCRGTYVMRIEDVDTQRSKPEFETRLLGDLRWLGLDWDEGPDVGGPYGPYRQSECGPRYQRELAKLATFACSCTRKELAGFPRGHGGEVIYPGTCRQGPVEPTRACAIRWQPPTGQVGFCDRLAGTVIEDVAQEVGDVLLRRRDGDWAYQFAVVVDDAAMGITDVMRGADLLASTARQIHLARALGYPEPRHAHVPLIFGKDGQKLSKRHGAPDLSALRERGVDPKLVVAALARSVGLIGNDITGLAPSDLVDLCRSRGGEATNAGLPELEHRPL
ncbi:MAG: tRNA glutamyl-Q(34) synthetase GluQRS, partial [Nannocystaceae bacterium]